MAFCTNCGAQLGSGVQFCPRCAAPVPPVPVAPTTAPTPAPVNVTPSNVTPSAKADDPADWDLDWDPAKGPEYYERQLRKAKAARVKGPLWIGFRLAGLGALFILIYVVALNAGPVHIDFSLVIPGLKLWIVGVLFIVGGLGVALWMVVALSRQVATAQANLQRARQARAAIHPYGSSPYGNAPAVPPMSAAPPMPVPPMPVAPTAPTPAPGFPPQPTAGAGPTRKRGRGRTGLVVGIAVALVVVLTGVGVALNRRTPADSSGPAANEPLFSSAGLGADWSPDGTRLVIWNGHTLNAEVWDAATGTRLYSLRAINYQWSTDGALLVTDDGNSTATVWDVATGASLYSLSEVSALDVVWSPDGARFALTRASDGTTIRDAATGESLLSVGGLQDGRPIWSPDGARLVGLDVDDDVRSATATVWDAATGTEAYTLTGILSLQWSPDGTRLATREPDGSVQVRDAATGAVTHTIPGPIWNLVWSPNGALLATDVVDRATQTQIVRVWDVTGREVATLPSFMGDEINTTLPAWSPDGTRLTTFGFERPEDLATVWDVRTGATVCTISRVRKLDWSLDGTMLAGSISVYDGAGEFVEEAARVWDAGTGEVIRTLTSSDFNQKIEIEWSPDGSRLATVADGMVQIWAA